MDCLNNFSMHWHEILIPHSLLPEDDSSKSICIILLELYIYIYTHVCVYLSYRLVFCTMSPTNLQGTECGRKLSSSCFFMYFYCSYFCSQLMRDVCPYSTLVPSSFCLYCICQQPSLMPAYLISGHESYFNRSCRVRNRFRDNCG